MFPVGFPGEPGEVRETIREPVVREEPSETLGGILGRKLKKLQQRPRTSQRVLDRGKSTGTTQVGFVSGPGSLTVHQDTLLPNRVVYVFGEMHGVEDSCPGSDAYSIEDYFSQTFETSAYPIDFFLESPLIYIKNDKGKQHSAGMRTTHMAYLREMQVIGISEYAYGS